MLVSQNRMALVKVEQGPYSEACLTSSHDKNLDISIKVEDVTDTFKEDPVEITFPVLKAEHEASYISVCTLVHFLHIYNVAYCLSLLHLSRLLV
jgi:hypothetical protein